MFELTFLKSVIGFIGKNWKVFALVAVVALLVGTGYKMGANHVQSQWNADTAKKDLAAAKQQIADLQSQLALNKKQSTITSNVTVSYLGEIEKVKTVTETQIKEVPVYVTSTDDRACTIHRGLLSAWNRQNAGDVSSPAGGIDDSPSTVVLSDVAREHAVEAGTCRATEVRLVKLQEWVREQYNAVNPKDPLPFYPASTPFVPPVVESPAPNDGDNGDPHRASGQHVTSYPILTFFPSKASDNFKGPYVMRRT